MRLENPRHGSRPVLLNRVSTAFSRRCLRRLSCRAALAGRVPLPHLWSRSGLGLGNQIVDLRVRRVRQTDFSNSGYNHAREQAAAERVVLRRLSDGHAPRRLLGHGIVETAETGIVQDGLAAVCQAALVMVDHNDDQRTDRE